MLLEISFGSDVELCEPWAQVCGFARPYPGAGSTGARTRCQPLESRLSEANRYFL